MQRPKAEEDSGFTSQGVRQAKPLTPEERAGAVNFGSLRSTGGDGGPATRWADVGGQEFVNAVLRAKQSYGTGPSANELSTESLMRRTMEEARKRGERVPAEYEREHSELSAKITRAREQEEMGGLIGSALARGDRGALKQLLYRHPAMAPYRDRL